MKITTEELNELLQKEYERGRQSAINDLHKGEPIEPINIPNTPYEPYTVNSVCKNCPNHPSNGGSGICHCILGDRTTYVGHGDTGTYVTTATNINTAKDKIQYTTNFIKHFLM